MSTHFTFNASLPGGSRLRNGLNQLEQGRQALINEQATMTAALDGDGSLDAHFNNVVTEYGFVNNSTAHSAWNELNADLNKITSDAATSNVDTALKQLFTKLR